MLNRFCLLSALVLSLAIAGCTQQVPPAAPVVVAPAIPSLTEPFKFHKMIESSPGEYFDILSWGRGAGVNSGAFMILRSDSAAKKFTTTTGDLEGAITNVYNADMDLDGDPEILIEAKVKDTINYTTIYAFEFNDSKSQKLDFPKLTSSQKKGYHGADNFYMKEGKLIREFEVYDGNTQTSKPTGQKRVLEYSMRGNNFTVKELSKDTAKVAISKPVAAIVTPKPKEETSTKKKKTTKHHHEEVVHHKKKKHHHHND